MLKSRTFVLLTFLCFGFTYSSAQSNSVEILIRAFIPDPVNAGQATGFIIPMPGGKPGSTVRLTRISSSRYVNQCFVTDNRGFSSNPSVTSRLETRFTIRLDATSTATVTPASKRTTAAVTTEVDCSTGAIIQQKLGSVSRDHLGTPSVADGTVQVIGQAQGLNMLAFLASSTDGALTPAIDYNFDLKWKPATSSLTASVTCGSFPAFEMYARQPGGQWIPIIQQLPTGTPWRLMADGFGINSTRITKTVIVH